MSAPHKEPMAFPMQYADDSYQQGMTLRDYFAAHAPAAPESWHGGNKGIDSAIEWRWSYADRMLKERQK